MKTELKPCPFCGGEAHATTGFTTGSDWPQGHFDRIFCGKCQVRQLFHRTKAEAIEAWNRRATPPSPSTAEVDERYSPSILDADGLPEVIAGVLRSDGDAVALAALYALLNRWGSEQRQHARRAAMRVVALASRPAVEAAPDKRISDALNTTLWLYRRLPSCYGNPPFVDASIMAFADVLGIDAPAAIKERLTLHAAALATKPATSAPGAALDEAAAYRLWRDCEISEDAWFTEHFVSYLPADSYGRAPTAVEFDAAMAKVMRDRAENDRAALEASFHAGIQQTRATLCGEPGAGAAAQREE